MAQIKSWRAWAHGLFAVIIGAISTGVLSGLTVNASGLDIKWRQFFITVGIGAALQAFAYLKQSPLPDFEDTKNEPPAEPKP